MKAWGCIIFLVILVAIMLYLPQLLLEGMPR